MALRAIVFLVLLLIPIGAQQAFATLIDFETFPDGTIPEDRSRISTQYAPCGVSLFTSEDPEDPTPKIFAFGLTGSSPPNNLGPTGPNTRLIFDIGIHFDPPVTGDISIIALEVAQAGLRLQAFDSSGLVDTFSIAPNSDQTSADLMTVTGDNIVRLNIEQISPTVGLIDGYLIDDLIFPGPACDETSLRVELIGGELIPIETTSLLIAGAQSFSWMIPVVLSGIGIGLFVASRKSENS